VFWMACRRGLVCGARRSARSLRRPGRWHRTAGGSRRSSCRRGAGPRAAGSVSSPSFASSLGNSGTVGGGGGMYSPSKRRTTQ
jgi:hypothetical protein